MNINPKFGQSRQGVSVPISLPFFNKLMKSQHALIATQIAKINKLTQILNAKNHQQEKKHKDNMHYYEGIQKYLQKELKKKKELLQKLKVVGGPVQQGNIQIYEKVDSINVENNQNKEEAPAISSQEQEQSSSERSYNNQHQQKQIIDSNQINEQMAREQIDYYQI